MDNQIGELTVERLSVLKVPIDIVLPETIPELALVLSEGSESKHIVLLSLMDLLRARRIGEYRDYVKQSSLVIPISKSVIGGTRFLTGRTPYRYMPFEFVIKLLTGLESASRSIYLFGGRKRILRIAERNLRQTFPRLNIVGRCAGTYSKRSEVDIITAIRKASPSLLLVGRGVPGGERWIERNKEKLGSSVQLWCSDLFDVFAEAKKRPSKRTFDRGLESFSLCFRNPFRVFRFLPYLYYKYLLLFYKIFRRS